MISTEEYASLAGVAADARFRYGSDVNQFMDLYVPTTGVSHPVVVLVHGGCWRERYDAKPLGGICSALKAAGLAVWSVEYRRNGNGGGYPQTMLDVAQATDMLREVAAEYHLDLARVITMGHSAGGQLALWLAGRGRLGATSPVYSATPLAISGVVCLAGIIDLVAAADQGLCGEDLALVMGGTPDASPEHYQDASPMALLPLGVKQIHVVGALDEGILANVRPYVEAAEVAGDDVRLVVIPDAGHFELVVASTAAWEQVCAAAIELAG